MQVVPRSRLPRLLRACGLAPETREFPHPERLHRLTVREQAPPAFTGGPHRRVFLPEGAEQEKVPVADRPALSAFVATGFEAVRARYVLATIERGALWLNNRAQREYLADVPDAQRVSRFLRRRGLTDRFQGGFLIPASDFRRTLPMLAAQAFSGGSDVLFAAFPPAFSVLACRQFDLHFTAPEAACLARIVDLAQQHGLRAEMLQLPDIR
ncbi:MAG: hypothetical protein RMJ43_01435 [Chloroherpetonaceae bacterium]|nr:hypothetical protein [Chthonomonadaceae bacterium]MDW8206471.1 hypothetical protein [Chloroherpetonaceae bacterium]